MATGIFKSVAELFRPVQATTPQTVVVQQAAPTPATPTTEPNPLDNLATLWQNDPNVKAPADPFSAPLLNTDPTKIAEAAKKIDFVSHIAPETLAKAMSGQDPAAFMEVMNSVAQRTLTTSAQINAATVEQATARNNSRIMEALPGRVKDIQLQGMKSDNPVLQHPAAQPFLQLTRAQIQMKNPGMSAADINQQAEHALLGLAQAISPAGETAGTTPASNSGEKDWDAWAKI